MSQLIKNLYVEHNTFDAITAIETRLAFDQKGRKHIIIASTASFIITELDGVEYCFKHDGTQQGNFASCRLAKPMLTRHRLAHNVVVDTEHQIIVYASNFRDVTVRDYEKQPGMKVLNSTHPKTIELLTSYGYPVFKDNS